MTAHPWIQRTRLQILPGTAVLGALSVCLIGLAPAAEAADVQPQQWYLKAMQAEKMWKVSTGKDIKVAVVDSGVDPSTSSLKGRVVQGEDFSRAPGDETRDDLGHGTTMAELIAGTGHGGIKGLAPGAKIVPFRINGEGVKGASSQKDLKIGDAIRAAANSDARIINLSFGGDPLPDLKEAVKYAVKKGKLLFAAAGNDAKKGNLPNFPAAYADVVDVAAFDRTGTAADYSNHSQRTILAGPGVSVPGWCDGQKKKYCSRGGTSAATALASASAALIWSHHPKWTSNQVLRVLIKTAGLEGEGKEPSEYLGFGSVRPRINLLENKGDPGDPDISPLTGEKTLSVKRPGAASGAQDSGKKTAEGPTKVADSTAGGGGANSVLPVVGITAGVVILVACGFAFVRIRRN